MSNELANVLSLTPRCSSSPPVENIALFPTSLRHLAVTVNIPEEADMRYGDQAGILLYASDLQWVKLVVEGDKMRGCRMVVLALMPCNVDALAGGAEAEATVSKKWSLGSEAPKAIRLRLELRRNDTCCSVIATCEGRDAVELPVPFDCARFGVMGHLCMDQPPSLRQHWFHFNEFFGSA